MKNIAVIYNGKAGRDESSINEIRAALRRRNYKLVFFKINLGIDELIIKVKKSKANVIVAAGGDGTVNATAAIAVKISIPMGVLPLGTLNHFAKDNNLPTDVRSASEIILKGNTTRIDYCDINGTVFVNNSSIGLYSKIVKNRENNQNKIGKWPAMFIAILLSLRNLNTRRYLLKYNNKSIKVSSPLIFIGNNSYEYNAWGFSNRASLTSGKLFIYAVRTSALTTIFVLPLFVFFGKRTKSSDLLLSSATMTIHTKKKIVSTAVDGEVKKIQSPLNYRIHSKGLKLIK